MKFVHYSKRPLLFVHDAELSEVNSKPRGLWFSVEGNGDGWREWCEENEFGNLDVATEIQLATHRMKIITTCRGLDEFNERYSACPPGILGITNSGGYIDWPEVCSRYAGIIIAPYLDDRRFNPYWYYSWDCASGCVWKADAILALRTMAGMVAKG